MFSGAAETREIDEVLSTYRAPAILLHRPYPPSKAPALRSRLGGLPTLPAKVAWPRGRNSRGRDVPLHFLAQIDCAELPRIDSRLPAKGMLFFFGRDDEEQIWEGGDPRDHSCVIYAPNVPKGQPPCPAPSDLPPIKDRLASDGPDWLLPNEPGYAVHYSWPVVALPFDTWPDASALDRGDDPRYDRRVEALRASAFMAATGLPSHSQYIPDWDEHFWMPLSLPLDRGNTRFPQVGIMVDRVSRLVSHEVLKNSNVLPKQKERILAKAHRWMKRAAEIGLEAAPSDNEVDEFQGWLHELASERFPPSHLRQAMPGILTKALLSSITYAAGAPKAAAQIPPFYYNVMENYHLPTARSRHAANVACNDWKLKTRVHQMLGHAPASQEAVSIESSDVCLLNLSWDKQIEFEFGDVGEATFWIRSDDLAAMQFDRAWASVQGH